MGNLIVLFNNIHF